MDLTGDPNVAELLQRDPGFNNYGFNRGLKQRYMSDFRFSNYGFDRGLKQRHSDLNALIVLVTINLTKSQTR